MLAPKRSATWGSWLVGRLDHVMEKTGRDDLLLEARLVQQPAHLDRVAKLDLPPPARVAVGLAHEPERALEEGGASNEVRRGELGVAERHAVPCPGGYSVAFGVAGSQAAMA